MRNIAKKSIRLTWPEESFKSAGDEDSFVIDYYKRKKGGYLVDIAAACPVSGSLSFKLLDIYEWFGILVEPSTIHKENIEACYGDVEGVHFYPGAIHRSLDSMNLLEYGGQGVGCSYTFENNSVRANAPAGNRTYTVPTISINKLLEMYNAPKDIDFMNLDIEGSEPEVLEDLDYEKYNVKLFCIENGIQYKDFLENKGYTICNTSGYTLMHGNLFFEKL